MFYLPEYTKFGMHWHLTAQCNYHCSYCFDQKKDVPQFKYDLEQCLSVVEWLQGQFGHLQVNFTGGEPTIHPLFFDLAGGISKTENVVFVVTNLSKPFQKFKEAIVNPALCWINASFHTEKAAIIPFAYKVGEFHEAGFNISCSQVLYPPFIREAIFNRQRFNQELPDVYFGFNVFYGLYDGKVYPEAYSQEERELLAENGIDLESRIEKTEVRHYQFCRAGKDFIAIAPNGKVKRCTSFAPLREEEFPFFSLFDVPFPCPFDKCLCPDMYEFRDDRYLQTEDPETISGPIPSK